MSTLCLYRYTVYSVDSIQAVRGDAHVHVQIYAVDSAQEIVCMSYVEFFYLTTLVQSVQSLLYAQTIVKKEKTLKSRL